MALLGLTLKLCDVYRLQVFANQVEQRTRAGRSNRWKRSIAGLFSVLLARDADVVFKPGKGSSTESAGELDAARLEMQQVCSYQVRVGGWAGMV